MPQDSHAMVRDPGELLHDPPLASSRALAWRGATVEVRRVAPGRIESPGSRTHVLTVARGAPYTLTRVAEGKRVHALYRAGTTGISPAGGAYAMEWDRPPDIVQLFVEPAWLAGVAEEEAGTDPARIEIVSSFGARDAVLAHTAAALAAELAAGGGRGSRLFADSHLALLAVHLLRHYASAPSLAAPVRGRLAPSALRLATEFIDAHLAEELPLARIAAAAHLSPFHFARAFRESTGATPHRFVTEQRIARAARLLDAGSLSAGAVGVAVGFAHQSQFTRHFRRLMGITPGRYVRDRGTRSGATPSATPHDPARDAQG